MREGAGLVGEVGRLAFQASRQVHEPQHVDGVGDCNGLWVWPVLLGPPGWGRCHVADDDGAGEHGHLAVCLGQGLEEGFRCVDEDDVGVDDVELPSLPNHFVDAQPPWDAQVVDKLDVDERPGI